MRGSRGAGPAHRGGYPPPGAAPSPPSPPSLERRTARPARPAWSGARPAQHHKCHQKWTVNITPLIGRKRYKPFVCNALARPPGRGPRDIVQTRRIFYPHPLFFAPHPEIPPYPTASLRREVSREKRLCLFFGSPRREYHPPPEFWQHAVILARSVRHLIAKYHKHHNNHIFHHR